MAKWILRRTHSSKVRLATADGKCVIIPLAAKVFLLRRYGKAGYEEFTSLKEAMAAAEK
jgi:hypothetical protein